MKPILCIYHGNCEDGFAAAWAVRHALGEENVEFHAGSYDRAPPDVTNRRVLMVDFSYKREVLNQMATSGMAAGILILDHHKTAQADLADLPEPPNFSSWATYKQVGATAPQWSHMAAVFDMNRSGAGLTWDFLHCGQPRPLFIDYVEDRDLWRKTLPGVEEFHVALKSYPQTFEAWDKHFAQYGESDGERQARDRIAIRELVAEGETLLRYHRMRIEDLKPKAYLAQMPGLYDGELAPFCVCVNASHDVASDLGSEIIDLFPGARFGVVYWQEHPHAWKYSLRSRDDRMDVSAVAQRWGGGGHRNAAGFTVGHPIHDAI